MSYLIDLCGNVTQHVGTLSKSAGGYGEAKVVTAAHQSTGASSKPQCAISDPSKCRTTEAENRATGGHFFCWPL